MAARVGAGPAAGNVVIVAIVTVTDVVVACRDGQAAAAKPLAAAVRRRTKHRRSRRRRQWRGGLGYWRLARVSERLQRSKRRLVLAKLFAHEVVVAAQP